jgi:hypothetical protein
VGKKAQPMARNPDRDFSAGNLSQQEQEELWTLFQRSEVADLFDASACERFGRLISRSAFNPTNPGWYSGWAEQIAAVSRNALLVRPVLAVDERPPRNPL